MTAARFFLDAGVPDSVADELEKLGQHTIRHRHALPDGSSDDQVCATAIRNDAILVAIDRDMRAAPRRYGKKLEKDQFAQLSLILFVCSPVQAASRLQQSWDLVSLEWGYASKKKSRRLWIEIGPHHIRTNR